MSVYRSSPIREQRHVRVSGGGVFVHQTWPEHVARCVEAVRRRRAAESSVLGANGEWS